MSALYVRMRTYLERKRRIANKYNLILNKIHGNDSCTLCEYFK